MRASVHCCNPERTCTNWAGSVEEGAMRAGALGRRPVLGVALMAVAAAVVSWGGANRCSGEEPEKAPETGGRAAARAKLDFPDQRLKEAWEQASVKPSPICTEEEFLRRAYLDVIGRIPNIQEATAYLTSKESGKRQKLVEYLLNHADFAKNLANQWTVLLI